jgi:hypothetical protein
MICRRIFTRRVAGLILMLLLGLCVAQAHEIRPAYLEITETAPSQFSVLWRTPVLAGMRLPIVLALPAEVRSLKDPMIQELTDSLVERRWIETDPSGIAGKRIGFPGLQLTITDVLVRIRTRDGRDTITLVRPSQPWINVAEKQGPFSIMGGYILQGIQHISFGAEHRPMLSQRASRALELRTTALSYSRN